MLHFICLILLASGFIVAQEKHLLCRTTDMELFYNSCGSSTETFFFEVEPCYLNGFSKWNGTIFWIPKRDLTFLRVILTLRHKTKKVIEWRHVACTGEDDEYTYCGALKGETINTTVRMSGDKVNIPMVLFQSYTIINAVRKVEKLTIFISGKTNPSIIKPKWVDSGQQSYWTSFGSIPVSQYQAVPALGMQKENTQQP